MDLAPRLDVSDVELTTTSTANPFGLVTSKVTYRLTNTGNTRLVPTERVRVAGPGGAFAVTASDDLDEILPGSATVRTVEVRQVRPAFRAEATVEVDGTVAGIGGGAAERETAAGQGSAAGWAVPWALLVLVVVIVLGAALPPVLISRRRGAATPG